VLDHPSQRFAIFSMALLLFFLSTIRLQRMLHFRLPTRGRQAVIEPAPHHRDDEDGAIASPFSGQAEQKQLQQQHHPPATPATIKYN